jgi:multidrug efflux system outer membrane protein
MKSNWQISSMALALALAGCTVGPNYHRPATSAPAQWSEPLAGGETDKPISLATWWQNFHDPELNSLMDRAIQSNLDLRIAQARVREARAQFQGAKADLWPSVNGDGSYERQRQSKNQPILGSFPEKSILPFENNVYQAGFDASWEIDVFGGKRRATQAAGATAAAAEFGRRDVLVSLLGEAALNYIQARSTQKRLAILHQNIEAQEQSLAITQRRFTNGLSSELDVKEAANLLATLRAETPTLETDLQVSMHRLSVLLAQPPGSLRDELSAVAPIPITPPAVPVGLPSDLLLRRPDVRQAERQLAAATAEIGVATADLFPKFSLIGTAGFESISASDWFTGPSQAWSIGPTVQWNIFDAGRIRANIKVQNARQELALANYEKTVLRSFEDVENALVSYAKEQVRHNSLEEARQTSQQSFDIANRLYANGLVNFINVLDAERSYYQAQNDLVQSDRDEAENLVSLYKALGGGWETQPKFARAENAGRRP